MWYHGNTMKDANFNKSVELAEKYHPDKHITWTNRDKWRSFIEDALKKVGLYIEPKEGVIVQYRGYLFEIIDRWDRAVIRVSLATDMQAIFVAKLLCNSLHAKTLYWEDTRRRGSLDGTFYYYLQHV